VLIHVLIEEVQMSPEPDPRASLYEVGADARLAEIEFGAEQYSQAHGGDDAAPPAGPIRRGVRWMLRKLSRRRSD
jgi:hypothetical protein